LIINRQSEVRIDLAAARIFAKKVHTLLRLQRKEFNVCFVSDREIRKLNAAYRGKPTATDVLSFPWRQKNRVRPKLTADGFGRFLGDVVISARTARRNARAEGHSTRAEISWLILHGVLHLLGYNHETDTGEMNALELSLRDRLSGRVHATKPGKVKSARRQKSLRGAAAAGALSLKSRPCS
jgi:probable rRNA maturation factor